VVLTTDGQIDIMRELNPRYT